MTYAAQIDTVQAAASPEHDAFMAAYGQALARATHSYFDQHIIRTDDGCYWVADEGSYETLMDDLIDRIVHTVPAGRTDDD